MELTYLGGCFVERNLNQRNIFGIMSYKELKRRFTPVMYVKEGSCQFGN